ncbi:hypothetical protein [Virgisporangium aliadipatigenens]|nr:hypothetical protein [Virgisporangium aliadipatigenens]
MALRQIAGLCDDVKTCPKIFEDGSDVVVQGYDLDSATEGQLYLPDGESAVRLPGQLVLDAARRLIEGP